MRHTDLGPADNLPHDETGWGVDDQKEAHCFPRSSTIRRLAVRLSTLRTCAADQWPPQGKVENSHRGTRVDRTTTFVNPEYQRRGARPGCLVGRLTIYLETNSALGKRGNSVGIRAVAELLASLQAASQLGRRWRRKRQANEHQGPSATPDPPHEVRSHSPPE